jgi:hypothetical protein
MPSVRRALRRASHLSIRCSGGHVWLAPVVVIAPPLARGCHVCLCAALVIHITTPVLTSLPAHAVCQLCGVKLLYQLIPTGRCSVGASALQLRSTLSHGRRAPGSSQLPGTLTSQWCVLPQPSDEVTCQRVWGASWPQSGQIPAV